MSDHHLKLTAARMISFRWALPWIEVLYTPPNNFRSGADMLEDVTCEGLEVLDIIRRHKSAAGGREGQVELRFHAGNTVVHMSERELDDLVGHLSATRELVDMIRHERNQDEWNVMTSLEEQGKFEEALRDE